MQLSDTERQRLTAILARYDQHPEVQRMREFIQHGDVTTYQHCKNVVLVSFWLNRRFHLGADETSLAVGAFLHDFYLYDWHKRSSFRGLRRLFEMHGFAHPGSACVNAERCFAITRKEQNIISSHMWPLTFRHIPTCREAVIVCLADKYCAVLESMFQRTGTGSLPDSPGPVPPVERHVSFHCQPHPAPARGIPGLYSGFHDHGFRRPQIHD